MLRTAPAVDRRSPSRIADQVNALLAHEVPGWPERRQTTGASAALIQIFARYAELVLQRINRVPDRNRLAFLGYLGASVLPPQPARAPLTFALAPGSLTAGVVPSGTQVAAAPAPGQTAPVIFETESELVVTAARLDQLFVKDSEQDRYANRSGLLLPGAVEPVALFRGEQLIEHTFYIGHRVFFGQEPLNCLTLSFDLDSGVMRSAQSVEWEIWDGATGLLLVPEKDSTVGLTESGDLEFHDIPVLPFTTVVGEENRWLRCRLTRPLSRPLVVRSVTLDREIYQSGLLAETALFGAIPVDLSKDFHPLGEKPKYGDVFYLANARAFSLAGATVTLAITSTNPAVGEGEIPVIRVNAGGKARVAWEYWDGTVWQLLGLSKSDQDVRDATTQFSDTTRAFTSSGEVSFRVPADIRPIVIGGIESYWIRARLAGGNYGEAAGYTRRESKPGLAEYVVVDATLAAPMLKKLEISFLLREAAQQPERLMAYNDFAYEDQTGAIQSTTAAAVVFRPAPDIVPALYLGFNPPAGLGLPSLPITVYFVFAPSERPIETTEDPISPVLNWQYWNGHAWMRFGVIDKTGAFTFSGTLRFTAPSDAQPKQEFGIRRYWLRAEWHGGKKGLTSPLRRVLLNTTPAVQGMTLVGEVLGSSNGQPNQVFHTAQKPVLDGEQLQVREPIFAVGGPETQGWISWQMMPDFHGSRAGDHHYVLDRQTGEVRFGDGANGRVPPAGTGNIRMARYRTGGGTFGNTGIDRIVQLKTTVPYVKAVTNPEPAVGGANAENLDDLLERAPRPLRHGWRAVTIEDYEDLALMASPGVARARCVPLSNLAMDPEAVQPLPGVVTVIIVPRTHEHRPVPDVELLNRVRTFLLERASVTSDVVVIGPEYVVVHVQTEIVVTTLEGITALDLEVKSRLLRFLDALHGGPDGDGWDFGREPHRSDFFSLLGSVPGVDHVRNLTIQKSESRPGAASTDRFLVCPGEIEVFFAVE